MVPGRGVGTWDDYIPAYPLNNSTTVSSEGRVVLVDARGGEVIFLVGWIRGFWNDAMDMDPSGERHTCLRLQLHGDEPNNDDHSVLFVKAHWFPSHFFLSVTDGLHAWTCNASETEVLERAEQWDQPVSEYIDLLEKYLGFQQPDSVYRFADAGDGHRRLSWTFEKEGVRLEGRWKCQPSPNSQQTTVEVLDFLMDGNIRLSDEVVRRSQAFESFKLEAEKCLAQSEKFKNEREEFESAVYGKFVAVLNSKKAKLRELRDKLQKPDDNENSRRQDTDSTDRTEIHESEDERNEEVQDESLAGTSKRKTSTNVSKDQKRISRR